MKRLLTRERLPILATSIVCLGLYLLSGFNFEGFFSLRVAFNFLTDNAFLGIIAVGLTFVILTGGIDLSVGSMVGFSGILVAYLVDSKHWSPFAAMALALGCGAVLGLMHGYLIAKFELAPFLVTLAGLFLCRGLALWISKASIQIKDPLMTDMASFHVGLPGGASLTLSSILFITVLLFAIYVSRQTTFGRAVFAIGGGKQSAVLMGLRVPQTLIRVYVLSGVCSALGGIVFAIYTSSGNAIGGTGMELDAIAAVVVGGTLLSGGYGSILGTFLGVLILAIIQTAITFQGTLSSWWTKIAIGTLLLIFMLMQRGIVKATERSAA